MVEQKHRNVFYWRSHFMPSLWCYLSSSISEMCHSVHTSLSTPLSPGCPPTPACTICHQLPKCSPFLATKYQASWPLTTSMITTPRPEVGSESSYHMLTWIERSENEPLKNLTPHRNEEWETNFSSPIEIKFSYWIYTTVIYAEMTNPLNKL